MRIRGPAAGLGVSPKDATSTKEDAAAQKYAAGEAEAVSVRLRAVEERVAICKEDLVGL